MTDQTPEELNFQMIAKLKADGNITDPDIERAFLQNSRHHFLPGYKLDEVFIDDARATHYVEGSEEAISSSSQPAMMAIMLRQLDVRPGMKVLEIGAGTGYNAAVMASLVRDYSNVTTMDLEPEYCDEARQNLKAVGKSGVNVRCGDGWLGWPEDAPYDRIIVTASAYDIALPWFEQLKDGGKIVLPWGSPLGCQRSMAFERRGDRLELLNSHFCGFMRMRGEFDWNRKVWEIAALEVPFALPCEKLDDWSDLTHFLSIYMWPLVPTIMSANGTLVAILRLLSETPWDQGRNVVEEASAILRPLVEKWQVLGRPSADRMHLTAYPIGTHHSGETVDIITRKWFDYVVSWGEG